MWTRNLLRGKNAGVGINATSIGFALRDPLPALVGTMLAFTHRN